MEQKIIQDQKPSYPKVSFKKCVVLDHQNTIRQLTYSSQQIKSNPTIKRCIQMHYQDERQKIFSFLIVVIGMKIGTKILHLNRSIALSAPRNWRSVVFKYLFIPYLYNIKRTLQQINNQVQQDPTADQLYQPLFQKKYPDYTQPMYASPFRKFMVEDVLQSNNKAITIL